MPRNLIAADNFNRAALGADWAQLNPTWGDITIRANTVASGSSAQGDANRQAARWVGAGTFAADQYASLALSGFDFQSSAYSIGVIVRAAAGINAARSYYAALVQMDGPGPTYTTRLVRFIAGVATQMHSAAVAWVAGDRLDLEVEGDELRVCKNGTPLGGSFTQSYTAGDKLTSGLPGIIGSTDAATVALGDDWQGGTITAGGGSQALAGAAAAQATAAGNLTVTGAGSRTVTAELVDEDGSTPMANLTGLRVLIWQDYAAWAAGAAPLSVLTGQTTNASGLLTCAGPGALVPGADSCWIVVSNQDAVPDTVERACIGAAGVS